MKTITAGQALVDLLGQAQELSEIRDAGGRILGFFAPVSMENAKHYAVGAAHFKPDELQRQKEQNGPGKSTVEVLQRLQSLESTQ